jgi:hypothetical protein
VNDDTPDVARAIDEARAAARAAGLTHLVDATEDTGETGDEDAGSVGGPVTSFTWHLSGLESAVAAGQLERILNLVPGVQARVVYSTSMAWVTAPDSLSPDVLRDLMAQAGVDAWLTTASLRRRAERLNINERRRRMRRHRLSQQRDRKHRDRTAPRRRTNH